MKSIRLNSFPGRKIDYNNREYLYFGGTAYLGMQTDPEFLSIYIRHVSELGTNYGASRLSNIQLEVYDQAEKLLGEWVGSASTISLSSGYLAGQLLAQHFHDREFKLFYAPNTHSSLFLDDHHTYENYDALKTALNEHLEKNDSRTPVICLDTIDFKGEGYPHFRGLESLPLKSCIVIADDSHGIGLVGKTGNGSFETLKKLNPQELILCCSLGKAMGLQAGAVFGPKDRLSDLRNSALFAGSSPASPAIMATLVEALPLYSLRRQRLLEHIDLFIDSLDQTEKFNWMDQYPVFVYDNQGLTEFLFEKGICVTNFNYPAESESWQSRIVLSAVHLEEDIQKLTSHINSFYGL